jgi:hypothetical protein
MTLWLVLLSARLLVEDRPRLAGFSAGLAVLGRSSAAVYLIALVVLLLSRQRWGAALRCALVAGLTVALGLLPFYLADRPDLLFSLVTFRGALGVSGGSLLGLTIGTPAEAWAQQHDSTLVLAGAAVVTAALALLRRDLTPQRRSLYGLLALAGLCFPLFTKTVWPYYFADLYVLLAVWWLGSGAAWTTWRHWLGAFVPFYFTLCALVAEYGAGLYNTEWLDPTDIRRESAAMSVLLVGFALAFGVRLLLEPRVPRPAASQAALAEKPPGQPAVLATALPVRG